MSHTQHPTPEHLKRLGLLNHNHNHNHGHTHNHNHNHIIYSHDHSHLEQPQDLASLTKSSDFINLTEPPEASKTPDPALLFPLKRRSSSNYQTALLSNVLRSSLSDFDGHHAQQISAIDDNLDIDNENKEKYKEDSEPDLTSPPLTSNPSWSSEHSKRSLQRGSIGYSNIHDHDQGIFNVQYKKPGTQGEHKKHTEDVDPLKQEHIHPSDGKSELRSYHSNQVDVPIPYSAPVKPASPINHHAEDYITSQDGPVFEYDRFKRSKQYDY